MTLAVIGMSLLIGRWWWEWSQHQTYLSQIPLKIHVNGTRGKSSVTRLIAAGLRQAGQPTVAKTTGSAARLIYPDGSESPWPRRGRPNINEQLAVIRTAYNLGARALVLECMALQPEIQWIAERLFPAQIVVITNVRPDHTDIFPGLESYAQALALTIPSNGWVVTTPGPFVTLFRECAAARNSQLQVVKPDDSVAWGVLGLKHHPENLALAKAVLQLVGIPLEVAKAGMAQATPDPGAFTIYQRHGLNGNNYLANAFAANDPISTKELLQRLLPPPTGLTPVVLYNHRLDRLQRARDFYPILAQLVQDGIDVYSIGIRRPPFSGIIHFGCPKPEVLLTKLGNGPFLIIGIGNIDGIGHELIDYFSAGGTQVWKLP